MRSVFIFISIAFISGLSSHQVFGSEVTAFASPYHKESIYKISPQVDSSLIAGSALWIAYAYTFPEGLVSPHCPCDPETLPLIDRSTVANRSETARIAATTLVGACVLGGIWYDYAHTESKQAFYEDLTVIAEAVSVSGALVTLVKFTVQRPFPYVYHRDAMVFQSSVREYQSFYSGHTTATVSSLAATAMTLRYRHGESIWPWVVTGMAGVTVGSLMVAAGEHFPTDVLVGGGMGLLGGILIPRWHRKDTNLFGHWHFWPVTDGGGLAWQKAF